MNLLNYTYKMVKVKFLIFVIFFAGQIYAQEIIPKNTGFDGFVKLGLGYSNISSNMLSGFMNYNLTNSVISSIDTRPDSKSVLLLTFPFEIAYTFVPQYTMIFIGQALEDLLRYDVTQQIGIRQRINKLGIIKAGVLINGIPTRVWEDPFLTNVERKESARTSFGFRVVWDMILNSRFRIQYTFRDVKINNELSGVSLNLPEENLRLLDRNGKFHRFQLLHRFYIDPLNLIIPSVSFIKDIRNGGARKKDGFDLEISYAYKGEPFGLVSNFYFGEQTFADKNPIYDVRQKDKSFGFTYTMFYTNPWAYKIWGSKPFRFTGTILYGNTNSNIEFYKQSSILVQLGILVLWN